MTSTITTAPTTTTKKIPFEIERLPDQPNESIYKEIAQMCINAFFNDDTNNNNNKEEINNKNSPWGIPPVFGTTITSGGIPFWKEWQLAYLRTLQESDLRLRRKRYPQTNMMFVARQVIPLQAETNTNYNSNKNNSPSGSRTTPPPSSSRQQQQRPLVLDLNSVYNLSPAQKLAAADYMYGPVIGFVEVTLRPYGLGSEQVGVDDESRIQLRTNPGHLKRPVLTNLSVQREARQSGVGSRLLQRCEQEVLRQQWPPPQNINSNDDYYSNGNSFQASSSPAYRPEIILEVESDNINALQFYKKRGFEELFEDPAGRRYDTTGFILRQLRCRRIVLRKDLSLSSPSSLLSSLLLSSTTTTSSSSSSSSIPLWTAATEKMGSAWNSIFSSSSLYSSKQQEQEER